MLWQLELNAFEYKACLVRVDNREQQSRRKERRRQIFEATALHFVKISQGKTLIYRRVLFENVFESLPDESDSCLLRVFRDKQKMENSLVAKKKMV